MPMKISFTHMKSRNGFYSTHRALEAEFISFNGSSVFLKELKTNIILNYLSEFSMEDQLLFLKSNKWQKN